MARRHGALLRSGEEMLPDEDDSVRDRMDARRLRRAAHHRQHVVPQALFRLARSLQHHARQRTAHARRTRSDGWRLLTVPSAFEMGLSDCRWIYRLGERTITVSATVSGDEPAMQWRVAVEGEAMPLPRLRPSRPRRAGIRACRPDGDRRAAKAIRLPARSRRSMGQAISERRLSPRDEHAPAGRSRGRR